MHDFYLVMQYGEETPKFMCVDEETGEIMLTPVIGSATKITESGHTLEQYLTRCRKTFPELKFVSVGVPRVIFGSNPTHVVEGVFFGRVV